MQRIFLDTTIQIRRLIYAPTVRQTIQKQLQGCEILTSTYVWMEVQRTIGQDFQYLIDLVLRKQPTTVAQLLYDLGEQETIFSSRTLARSVQLVAQLLDEFQPETFHPIDGAIFLQQQREWMVHHAFFAGINQVLDTTQCDLVRPPLHGCSRWSHLLPPDNGPLCPPFPVKYPRFQSSTITNKFTAFNYFGHSNKTSIKCNSHRF